MSEALFSHIDAIRYFVHHYNPQNWIGFQLGSLFTLTPGVATRTRCALQFPGCHAEKYSTIKKTKCSLPEIAIPGCLRDLIKKSGRQLPPSVKPVKPTPSPSQGFSRSNLLSQLF